MVVLLIPQLIQTYRNLPGFISAAVTGFAPGSVRVLYEVVYDPSAGGRQADFIRLSQEIANDDDFTNHANRQSDTQSAGGK